jgi:hypothetical protein
MFRRKQELRAIAGQAADVSALRVTVVYSYGAKTQAVFRRAAALVTQLGAEIRILAPMVVPYPLPLERPPVDPAFVIRKIVEECESAGIAATVDVRLCRDLHECVRRELEMESVVLVRHPRPWAWNEKRLAKALRRDGHRVVSL